LFNRYASIVPDGGAFQRALQTPQGQSFWIHPERAPREAILQSLTREGVPWVPSPLGEGIYRVLEGKSVGQTVAFEMGTLVIQEEVAMLPVLAAGIKAGDRVLDLCAAPGNKTAVAAFRAGPAGCVIANDVNAGRLRIVQSAMERLGLTNVVLTRHDAASFPRLNDGDEGFDVVLADVPCSGEGMARRVGAGQMRTWSEEERLKLCRTQVGILRRAVKLCRRQGVVVYSTCTYAPEENEGVLDEILSEFGSSVALLDWDKTPLATRLPFHPALTSWQGRNFSPSLSKAARFWPHETGSGGFFIALLECGSGR
jgi:16S rRNA C967 or C1407 C5-methylase (RsmB/RsmF family)